MTRIFIFLYALILLFSAIVTPIQAQGSQPCRVIDLDPQVLDESGPNVIENFRGTAGQSLHYFRVKILLESGDGDFVLNVPMYGPTLIRNQVDTLSDLDNAVSGFHIDGSTMTVQFGRAFAGSNPNSAMPIFDAGVQAEDVIIEIYTSGRQSNDTKFCEVPIKIVPIPTPTEIPRVTPVTQQQCKTSITPLTIASSNVEVYATIFDASDELLENIEQFSNIPGSFEYYFETDKENVFGADRKYYIHPGDVSTFDGRLVVRKYIGKFNPDHEVQVSFKATSNTNNRRYDLPCAPAQFIIGIGLVTPTPTFTPEEVVQKDTELELKGLCENIPVPLDEANEIDEVAFQKYIVDANISSSQELNLRVAMKDCLACLGGNKIYTAFGCLPTSVEGFFEEFLFRFGLGLAGGVALLLMLWGSFQMLISRGDPQQIQNGREVIVSAITGLLLIIFSVFIIQFFGYNVLRLPGFGTTQTETIQESE